jgi:hypothetical protein
MKSAGDLNSSALQALQGFCLWLCFLFLSDIPVSDFHISFTKSVSNGHSEPSGVILFDYNSIKKEVTQECEPLTKKERKREREKIGKQIERPTVGLTFQVQLTMNTSTFFRRLLSSILEIEFKVLSLTIGSENLVKRDLLLPSLLSQHTFRRTGKEFHSRNCLSCPSMFPKKRGRG